MKQSSCVARCMAGLRDFADDKDFTIVTKCCVPTELRAANSVDSEVKFSCGESLSIINCQFSITK